MNDGGPAFPEQKHIYANGEGVVETKPGMSMRDYFAAKALAGVLGSDGTRIPDGRIDEGAALVARIAYKFADAMLAEREKGPTK